MAQRNDRQFDTAIGECRRAVALRPDSAGAYVNLGIALRAKGQLHEAIAAFQRAIALNPAMPQGHGNLGVVLRETGQLDQAIAAYRQAIALDGNLPEFHNNLGVALKEKGQLDEAVAACLCAIALRPNYAEAHANLGNALIAQGQFDRALTAYRQAIVLKPNFAKSHGNLGKALRDAGRLDEAMAAYRRGIALDANVPELHHGLAAALRDAGQLDEAIVAWRQAIALRPDYADAHSALIATLHLHPAYDAGKIAEELSRWRRQFAEPLKKLIVPPSAGSGQGHGNDARGDRRLRIGYVSPDLCDHPVGRFLLPLLDHHDRRRFEVFCYSDAPKPDLVTDRIRGRADVWRDIAAMADEAVAATIRQDRIDILVDLAMHTAGNRLLVFARKPAPVQAAYLAYCSTTGLETMDYRLTDPHLDPPGELEPCYSEKSVWLPDTYWCYEPAIGTPAPGPLPALAAGQVTFGCLNHFAKVSPDALSAWARLLRKLPGSRLLLHARPGDCRRRTLDRLKQEDVDPARLTFVDLLQRQDYLRQYHQIDIGLDPFPYCGGATTCDALWMGVPVVTLRGATAVGRSGVSLLANVGLSDLVANTPEQYVELSVRLASDLLRLAQLRAALREKMLRSPLMDAPRFARNVEAAYRQMWREHCEAKSARK